MSNSNSNSRARRRSILWPALLLPVLSSLTGAENIPITNSTAKVLHMLTCYSIQSCEYCPKQKNLLEDKNRAKEEDEDYSIYVNALRDKGRFFDSVFDACLYDSKYRKIEHFECSVVLSHSLDDDGDGGSTVLPSAPHISVPVEIVPLDGDEDEDKRRIVLYKHCRSTAFDDEIRLLEMQMFCTALGFLAVINMRKEKRKNLSMFDKRKLGIDSMVARKGSDTASCVAGENFEMEMLIRNGAA